MNLTEMKALHATYLLDVKKYTGFLHEHDASTRPEGIHHLIQLLDRPDIKIVGECGSGFSTRGLRTWRKQTNRDVQFLTLEHDEIWRGFIAQILRDHDLPHSEITTVQAYKSKTLMMAARPFHAVFIDHGPTMAVRWEDVPWIASLVKPGGLMIFDDW